MLAKYHCISLQSHIENNRHLARIVNNNSHRVCVAGGSQPHLSVPFWVTETSPCSVTHIQRGLTWQCNPATEEGTGLYWLWPSGHQCSAGGGVWSIGSFSPKMKIDWKSTGLPPESKVYNFLQTRGNSSSSNCKYKIIRWKTKVFIPGLSERHELSKWEGYTGKNIPLSLCFSDV